MTELEEAVAACQLAIRVFDGRRRDSEAKAAAADAAAKALWEARDEMDRAQSRVMTIIRTSAGSS